MRYGLATRDITPRQPVYLAGYAARTAPSEGVYAPLLARVLTLSDGTETLVWVTVDLIGFDAEACARATAAVAAAAGVAPEQVLLSASHTHCGPVLRSSDRARWGADCVGDWDAELFDHLAAAAAEAVSSRREARLEFALGHSTMGINRRLLVNGVAEMRPNPAGPLDPEVALLRLWDGDAAVALLVSYGCHPTTMGGQLVGPDYIGFLRRAVEAALPGVAMLFANGCGADVKPRHLTAPDTFGSGPLSAVESRGRVLADDVLAAWSGPWTPVEGPLATRRQTIDLPLQPPLSAAGYEAVRRQGDVHHSRWAQAMLDRLAAGEPLPAAKPFTLQVVTCGRGFCLVALGGEVCCEIGLHLKRALAEWYDAVMVVAYSHAVDGYQAARRQFAEGGYEVDRWSRYGDDPAPYDEGLEDLIVDATLELASPRA